MLALLVALATGANPVLLQDLAPGAAVDMERALDVDTGAEPNLLVIATPFWGSELFTVLDGKRSLVADLCPGPCSSNPRQLTRLDGAKVLFLAGDDGLWFTDGTPANTVQLASGVLSTPRLTPLEGQVLFSVADRGIWVTNGTREGTGPVAWGKDRTLVASALSTAHRFAATRRPGGGCDLFVSGTDVRNATPLQMPAPTEECGAIAVLDERAFLSFSTGVWRFAPEGGAPVLIDPQSRGPVRAGAGLYFFSFGPTTLSLFYSQGAPNDRVTLGILPSAGLRDVIPVGSSLVFSVVDANGLAHLHGSDGTPAGTVELGTANSVLALVAVGPVGYAVVSNAGIRELVETDGTKTGTFVLPGIHPVAPLPDHAGVTGHARALAFIGTVVNETGVFRLRPGEDPETVFPQPANPRDSASGVPVVAGRYAFFTHDGRVFRTDGTAEGTAAIADGGLVGLVRDRLLLDDGAALRTVSFDGGEPRTLGTFDRPVAANFGATAVVSSGSAPARLAVTDGTPGGTRGLVTLGDGVVRPPVRLGDGRAVFPAGERLWFTDGATSAAVVVPGLGAVAAGEAAVWAVARGTEVWRVTEAGTSIVRTGTGVPTLLTATGDDLFFAVGGELWRARADGPARLLGGLADVRAIAVHHGRVMVLGEDQLFEWADEKLQRRAPAPKARFLVSAGVHLYADVASTLEGQELHTWSEPFGLFLSTGDLAPGPGSSSPSPPVALGPRVLFTAWTPETGREPFAWEPPAPPEAPSGCGCGAANGGWGLTLVFACLRRRRSGLNRRLE